MAGAISLFTVFDNQTVISLNSNDGIGVGTKAQQSKETAVDIQKITSVELKVYLSLIGLQANVDYFSLQVDFSTTLSFLSTLASDGLYIYNGTSYIKIGNSLVRQGQWQIWRFLVNHITEALATCDIYVDNDNDKGFNLIATGIDCSYIGSFTEGKIYVSQHGESTNYMLSYIDYIKIDNGLVMPLNSDTDWVRGNL